MHLNPLFELEKQYQSGALKKGEYIDRIYDVHRTLFAYSEFIRSRNIEKITITDGEVLVTTKDNVTMVCNPGDVRIIPIEMINFGDFEAAETKCLLSFVQNDSVVLDIGANIGCYSILLGRAAVNGRIIAFEPIPPILKFLKRNFELNGSSNIELHEHGLSDEEKDIVFFFNTHLSGATSAQNLLDNQEAVEVRARVKRLDDVMRGEARIDLIKCDIEGGELFALRGGMATIKRTLPVLFVEMLRKWSAKFGYHPNDIIDLLDSAGYNCFAIEESGKLSRLERMVESVAATNFISLHRDKHKGMEKR